MYVFYFRTFQVPYGCFQLIRNFGITKGEKDVGKYVGPLVRVVIFEHPEFLNEAN